MELSCKIAVNASKEKIWPYYTNSSLFAIWEEDLESIVYNGEIKTGTTGRMKLAGMPEIPFTLSEVIENASYCDRSDIPGVGSLFFDHKILNENGTTYIRHSVRLEKDKFTEEDMEFLNGVFNDVPKSMMIIKREVERSEVPIGRIPI